MMDVDAKRLGARNRGLMEKKEDELKRGKNSGNRF